MTIVQVTFPVLRGTRRFFVEKGRRWSVVEHLLLDAVRDKPASAADLASRSHLPRRVVVEAFIRLMRAGWVEISATHSGSLFKITVAGTKRVNLEQLPAATVTEPRWRGFVIDQVTGCVFRSRELDLVHRNQLPVGSEEFPVVHLNGTAQHALVDLSEVFTTIEGEDELIVGVERGADKLTERFAIVTVRDSNIEGLSTRASPLLQMRIMQAVIAAQNVDVSETGMKAKGQKPLPATAVDPEPKPTVLHNAVYDQSDLLIDGNEHARGFERIITAARERLIIHSTFISEDRIESFLPLLLRAAERGVKIDVLWGQDDVGSATKSSQFAAAKLQGLIEEAGRSGAIKIHSFSTNSHVKIVIADTAEGKWHAIVGSCNWLASDYASFETSMRLRDPHMVGSLVRNLAGLAKGRPGVWNDLAIELTVLGRRIMTLPAGGGRAVPMRLIYGSEHAQLVLEARDKAQERIFAMSHRIGISARPVALLPALAAVKEKGIEAQFFYGRTTGPLTGINSADLISNFSREGVVIKPIHTPRLHAKVFGWDNNTLAISSLNWLSADPSEAAPSREIGVVVEAPKIAENFITRFENAQTP